MSNNKISYESKLNLKHRTGELCLRIDDLCYEVAEHGEEWWQRLASLKAPWKQADDVQATKRILNNITFSLKNGQMLAILGSSGSGKTSLLDAISCQITGGNITGSCMINKKRATPSVVKQCSAYVRQNDRLLPHLTVHETLMFVAQLKLPKSWTKLDIQSRVESVIAELGLRHVAHSKVGGAEVRGISGGERRRVSIGIQLLLDPDILFLDEPTSGLDAFTAHHLVETLSRLAKNNRIVVLTIHQPRSDIFNLFDMMMLISRGNVVYNGLASALIPYFTDLGYPCPSLTNPCDYYVDLVTVDMKSVELEQDTIKTVENLAILFRKYQKEIALEEGTVNTRKHSKSEINSEVDAELGIVNNAFEDEGSVIDETDATKYAETKASPKTSKKNGKLDQFSVLIRRSFSNNMEDYRFLGVQAIEAICMSLMNGLIFYQLGLDQISMRDRFGLLYMIMALYPYMVMLDVIGQCHREKKILYFEMLDGLYAPLPYFCAKILCDIPEHTVFVVLYAVPVYFLSALKLEAKAFFVYFIIIYTLVLCSRMIAYLSAALLPAYQISVLFSQTVFTFSLLSCGFIFNLDNIFIGVRWTSYISYLKWGFQSISIVEFRGQNFTCNLQPSQQDSCIWTGEQALELYSLNDSEVWIGFLAIFIIATFFMAMFYLSLRYISQKPHEQ